MHTTFFLTILLLGSLAFAGEGGYLFATFKGEQTSLTEQIYFATSGDGRNWTALNGDAPVLVSTLGEKGVRDPYLLRARDGKKFYLLATDLSINLNRDWTRAVQRGSRSIVVWESDDLVHWSDPRLVKVAADDAGCTWAPEAVYDEDAKDYLVFWASKNAGDQFAKHRIWASHTKDFVTFGPAFVYIDKPTDVIDTDIVYESGRYYRFSKDETFKAITMETSATLAGPWQDVPNFSLANLRGYEGPTCFQLQPATTDKPAASGKAVAWCLLLDQYSKGTGYHPFVTHDLAGGIFEPDAAFNFPYHFRHGSVLPITPAELERVEAAYK